MGPKPHFLRCHGVAQPALSPSSSPHNPSRRACSAVQAGSGPPPGPSCPCGDSSARGRSKAPDTLGLQATWVASCPAGFGVPFKAPMPCSDGGHTQPPPSLAKVGTGSPTSGPQMSWVVPSAARSLGTQHSVPRPRLPSLLWEGAAWGKQGTCVPDGSDTGLGVRLASRLASALGHSEPQKQESPGEAPNPSASCWDLGGQQSKGY